MRIFNFGSINIDEVYQVNDIVRPGETISSHNVSVGLGGKGLNQSIAIARSGGLVTHIGYINKKDTYIKDFLSKEAIDINYIKEVDIATGKAMIQVSNDGENSIVLNKGANHEYTKEDITDVFNSIDAKSIILVQNETNNVNEVLKQAKNNNHITALNMAPINENTKLIELGNVDYLIVNQIEGTALTDLQSGNEIIENLIERYPEMNIVLTLGAQGVIFKNKEEEYSIDGKKVDVVDTTGAGDTFVGYFMNGIIQKNNYDALRYANTASSISIGRYGAAHSIPLISEVEKIVNDK